MDFLNKLSDVPLIVNRWIYSTVIQAWEIEEESWKNAKRKSYKTLIFLQDKSNDLQKKKQFVTFSYEKIIFCNFYNFIVRKSKDFAGKKFFFICKSNDLFVFFVRKICVLFLFCEKLTIYSYKKVTIHNLSSTRGVSQKCFLKVLSNTNHELIKETIND